MQAENNDRLSVNPLDRNSKADISHIYDIHVAMYVAHLKKCIKLLGIFIDRNIVRNFL